MFVILYILVRHDNTYIRGGGSKLPHGFLKGLDKQYRPTNGQDKAFNEILAKFGHFLEKERKWDAYMKKTYTHEEIERLKQEEQKLREQEILSNINLRTMLKNHERMTSGDGDITYNYEDRWKILQARAEKINLEKIGVISGGLIDFYINDKLKDYNERVIKLGCAQALLHGIAGGQTEAALVAREIMPSLDLLDGKGDPLKDNNWVQPHPMRRYGQPDGNYHGMDFYSVYTTSRASKNDQKVIIITGLEFLNGYNGVAAEEVQFWRKGVKLIDRIPITKINSPIYKGFDKIDLVNPNTDAHEGKALETALVPNTQSVVYHNNMVILNTAIMFKKDDLMDIKFAYSGNVRRTVADHDEIKLKGWVFEALGSNAMG